MKNLAICFMFLFSFLSYDRVEGQEIFYSKEQKFTFQNSDFSVVGWSGDRLYTYRSSKEGYYLDAYNDSMRLMATIALDFFPQKIYETRFIASENQIVVLYQAVQNNQVVQYIARLDSRAMLIEKPKVLDAEKMGWLASDRKYYSSVVSADKSKIMVFSLGNRRDKKVQFKTILLDSNLSVLAKSSPYIEGDDVFSMGRALLGNDGTLYISGSEGSGSRNYSGDAWLFKLSPEGQFLNITLPLGTNFLSGLYIKLDDVRNEVYIGAFYSTKKNGNLDGVVYGMYTASTNELTAFKTLPFDDELKNGADDRNKKKAFNDYIVKDIIVKNDGGFILIAENYYVTTRNTSYGNSFGYYSWYNNGPYGNTSVREYHYGDILSISYSITGERQWSNFIRKEQFSQDDSGLFSSYLLLNSGASLVFLYNDFSTSKSTLNLAAVDGSGTLQLKKMNQGRAMTGDWMPRSGKQTDAQEILVPVLKKNSLWFARVAF